MARPLNFAVIGCGMLAQANHIPHLAASEKAVLRTCCDLSDDCLAICRDKFGALYTSTSFEETIADPAIDAICLATTEKLRLPAIARAAALGKPVYCEKPVAPTLEELYRIRDVVRETAIPFCAGHNRRSGPAMVDAHRIFRAHMENPQGCPWRFDREGPEARAQPTDDGVAGMSVRINDDWYSWKGWVFDPDEAIYGPLLFEMTHFTDLCNWFMAAEPVAVMAMETGMLNHSVAIRYANGELASIFMCANGTFGYPKELYEMFGNGGAVVVDHMLEVRTAGIAGVQPRRVYPMVNDRHPHVGTELGFSGWLAKKRAACAEAEEQNDPSLIFTAEPNKGHCIALERFIDEINGHGPMVCGIEDAVQATRVAFAAIKAANEKRVVELVEI